MSFQPEVGQELLIEGVSYRVVEHPAAPSMPHGQEGRQAVVYQLVAGMDRRALKVFKQHYRTPALVLLAARLALFAYLPGLAVCRRVVLSAHDHGELLRQYPDLAYAVLMTWVPGPAWAELMMEGREVAPEQSLVMSRGLLGVLVGMEERGLAHCDLSGPNVLLPALAPAIQAGEAPIALVDVEGLHGPGLDRPALLPAGSPGYGHPSVSEGVWEPNADRFAGAVLVAEMLAWCDERVRQAAWGESYFDPEEMRQESERFRTLVSSLETLWGQGVAGLFQRAWRSEQLSDCPTFGEWLVALPEPESGQLPESAPRASMSEGVAALLLMARQLEGGGDPGGALRIYQRILEKIPAGSSLHGEVELIITQIGEGIGRQADLERREGEAREHEEVGRWQEAAALYEGLLFEAGSPQQRAKWEEGLGRSKQESGLADLFDTAVRLMERKRWNAARELLVELVRQRPGYERQERKATGLLARVETDSATRRDWLKAAAAAAALMGLLVALVVSLSSTTLLEAMTGRPTSTLPSSPTAAASTPDATSVLVPVQFPVPTLTATQQPTHTPGVTSVPLAETETPTATPEPPTEEPASPPEPPTATARRPTAAPVPPTETLEPTEVPVPADAPAPEPTETPMPEPTETPVPTETPAPPTETPVPPTETPVPPTATPVPPTETPVPPTATPVPPPPPTPVPPLTNTTTPAPHLDNPRVEVLSSQEIAVTVDYCHGQARGAEVLLEAQVSVPGGGSDWFDARPTNVRQECGSATTRVVFRPNNAPPSVTTGQIEVSLRVGTQVIYRRTIDYVMTWSKS